jgi:hypothetical protein
VANLTHYAKVPDLYSCNRALLAFVEHALPANRPEIEVTQHVGAITELANLRCVLCGIRFAAMAFAWPTTTRAYSTGAAWVCWLAPCCTGSWQACFCGRKPARPFTRVPSLISASSRVRRRVSLLTVGSGLPPSHFFYGLSLSTNTVIGVLLR